jgi:hypothetical protein
VVVELSSVFPVDFSEDLKMLQQSLEGRAGESSNTLFFSLLLMRRCHGVADGVSEFFAAEDVLRDDRSTWEQRHALGYVDRTLRGSSFKLVGFLTRLMYAS